MRDNYKIKKLCNKEAIFHEISSLLDLFSRLFESGNDGTKHLQESAPPVKNCRDVNCATIAVADASEKGYDAKLAVRRLFSGANWLLNRLNLFPSIIAHKMSGRAANSKRE